MLIKDSLFFVTVHEAGTGNDVVFQLSSQSHHDVLEHFLDTYCIPDYAFDANGEVEISVRKEGNTFRVISKLRKM